MITLTQYMENERIWVATMEGQISIADAKQMMKDTHDIQQTKSSKIYWILDLTTAKFNYSQIIQLIPLHAKGSPGAIGNARDRVLLVGSSPMIRLFTQAMRQKQFGNLNIPLLLTVKDAVLVAEIRMTAEVEHFA